MKYQIFFIPIWLINCSHMERNNSEVFITYSGHSDLERLQKVEEKGGTSVREERMTTAVSETEGVVFIPNEKPVFRVGDDINVNDDVKINDLVNNRRIDDLMRDVKIATENPNQDTFFISGKNNENVEKQEVERHISQDSRTNTRKSTKIKQIKLDCTHLDCNNTVNSVCGGRELEKKWKYRLFLNECFFRKVNCGFQHAANRYILMPVEKCKNIGAHYVSRPFVFKPIPIVEESKAVLNETRRSFSSRRSLNMGVDGSFCGHSCPTTCTEEYNPECALSNSGLRKVFLNHCKLDYNSCLYKVVWHRRPLSECVGGRKADMNQNRGFIGWMQRVGIVDGKGRLMLS